MNLRGVSGRFIGIFLRFLLILIEFCVVFTALSQNGSIIFFFALSLSKVVITLRGFCKTQDFMFFEAEQMQCFETIFVL